MNQWKLTDLTVKKQITDSISENLTDSDLESKKGVKKYAIKVVLFQVKKDVQNWDTQGCPFVSPFWRI